VNSTAENTHIIFLYEYVQCTLRMIVKSLHRKQYTVTAILCRPFGHATLQQWLENDEEYYTLTENTELFTRGLAN
jgi:hypothetical protein